MLYRCCLSIALLILATCLYAVDVDQGLVLHWNLDEGAGTVVSDSSSSDINGTLVNSPTWQAGYQGSSLHFDGTSSYVSAGDAAALDFAVDMSWAMWVKVDTPDLLLDMRLVSKKDDWQDASGYEVIYNPYLNRLAVVGGGSQIAHATNIDLDNTWHHLAVSVASGTVQVYVDGVGVAMASAQIDPLAANTRPLHLARTSSGVSPFVGQIDEVRAYNTAISADVAAALAGTSAPVMGSADFLWRMDEAQGSVVAEAAGNGPDGSLSNATWGSDATRLNHLVFNGSSSLLTFADAPVFDLLADRTLSFWLQVGDPNENRDQRIFSKKDKKNDKDGWFLTYNPSSNILTFRGSRNQSVDATYDFDSNWHQVSVLLANGTIQIYIDGNPLDMVPSNLGNKSDTELENGWQSQWGTAHQQYDSILTDAGSAQLPKNLNSLTTNVGQLSDGSLALSIGGKETIAEMFNGAIDDLRIYNEVLTNDDVDEIVAGTDPDSANQPPVITSSPVTTATEDQLYQYAVTVSDPNDDNSGVDLTWSLLSAPSGMSISATGVISWTPTEGVLNSGQVTVQVADGGEDGVMPDTQSFTISVTAVNDAPLLAAVADTNATEDELYTYQLAVTDPDDDNNGSDLSFALSNAPSGMTVSATGLIEWTPGEGVLTSGTVTATVSDGGEDGAQPSSVNFTVTVTPVNDAPVITSTAPTAATEDQLYSYQPAVTDPDDDNDGTALAYTLSNAPTGMTVSTTGLIEWTPTEGVLTSGTVTLSVADGGEDGAAAATEDFTVSVTPVNDAPVITSTAPTAATEDQLYSYQLAVTDPDDDNDGTALTYTLNNAPTGMTVSATGLIEWTPLEGVLTSGTLTVSVADGGEDAAVPASETFTVAVTAVNDAPVITSTAPTEATEDQVYSYQLAVTDPDDMNDGTALTFTLSDAPEGMTVSTTGLIEWTPLEGVLSSGAVTVTVADGGEDGAVSASETFTVAVTAVNDAPAITSTAPVTATEDQLYSYQLLVDDPDDANNGSDLFYVLSGAPSGMTVNGTGLIEWTPAEGVLTSGSVSITVSDGGEDGAAVATETFTVTVTPVNDAPTITSTAPASATEDVLYSYQVAVSDPDDFNNGSDLTFALSNAPSGMTVSATGLIEWTPLEGVLSSGDVTVSVADGGEDGAVAASETFTVSVNPVNDAPAITSTAPTTATEDVLYSYQVAVSDSDDDNNGTDLTFALSNAPAGMIVSATGLVEWTPAEGVLTSGTVTLSVADGGEDGTMAATEAFTVTVTPVNDAPAITSTAPTTAIEDVLYTYQLAVTDPDDDNDGTALTYTLSNAPSGMTISATGLIAWTPGEGILSSGTVGVSVSDGGEDGAVAATEHFTITVTPVNDAPIISSTAPTTATEDQLYSYQVAVTDPDDLNDGTALTYTLSNAPSGMSVSATGLIEWTPLEGVLTSGTVSISVADGGEDGAAPATENFTVSVTAVNDAPVLAAVADTDATEDVLYTYQLAVSDPDDDNNGSDLNFALSNAPSGMTVSATGLIEWTPGEGVLTSGTVTATVSDGGEDGAQPSSVNFVVTVTPVNDGPVITSTAPTSAIEDQEYTYTVIVNDPDNDPAELSFNLSNAPTGMAIDAAGTIRWTPGEGVLSSGLVTVSVSDGGADGAVPATETFEVSVTPVNDAPLITSTAPATATEDVLYSYQLAVTDPDDLNDGMALSYALSNAPTGMTVSATGLIEWTPLEGVLTSGTVTVSVADGGEDAAVPASETFTVTVTAVNDAPAVTSTAPATATEDILYSYQVSVSDPDDDNNGTDLTFALTNAPTGMSVSATGLIEWTPGEGVLTSGTVTISVTDGGEDGATPATENFTVTVTPVNDAPLITSTAPTTATEDQPYSYQVGVTDPDDDNDGTALTYALSNAPDGMTVSSIGLIEWTPLEGVLTSGAVTISVADGGEDGAVPDSETFTITVTAVNDAPVITSTAPTTATEDQLYSYVVEVSDVDNDEGEFTFSISNAPDGMFMDPEGGIFWTPGEGVLTSGQVTVSVSDGGADGAAPATEMFEVAVTPVNDAPIITSTAPTTATEDQLYSYQLAVTDPDDLNDGTALTYTLINAPTDMTITSTGLIEWTPLEGVLSSGAVTVSVADGGEDAAVPASETFTVTVTPVNDQPVITSTAPTNAIEDTLYSYQVVVDDPDDDNDGVSLNYVLVNEPSGMTVSTTGLIEWTPLEGVLSSGEVRITVTDGGEDATTRADEYFTISVTPVNDAPVITSTAPTTAEVDQLYSYQVAVNDPDDDNNGSDITFTVSGAPTGMTVSGTGLIEWTPASVQTAGPITLNVVDGGEDAAAAATEIWSITVTGVNEAPVAVNDSWTVLEGGSLTDNVLTNDTDADEDTLTAVLVTAPQHDPGMTLNADGSFTYNHDGSETISDSFTYKANDGTADSNIATVSISITPVNDAPLITSIAPADATEGLLYSYQVAVTDADDDNNGSDLNFTLTDAPAGMTISASGLIEWTPLEGVLSSGTVTVTVADGGEDGAASAVEAFTVSVTPVDDPPVILSTAPSQMLSGTTYTYEVLAIDPDSAITWSLSNQPAGMSISSTGVITWTPAEGVTTSGSVTVTATGGSLSDSETFTVSVNSVGVALASLVNDGMYDPAGSHNFGWSVDVSGDIAIIGSLTQPFSGTTPGAAYIYERSGSNWVQQAVLTASDGTDSDYYGVSVSVDGDIAVVGAERKDGYEGAAYIYVRNGTTWTEQAKLKEPVPLAGGYFGHAVCVYSGNIIVSAAGGNSSSVFVYTYNGSSWALEDELIPSDPGGISFGSALSMDGETLLIGADNDDDFGSISGSAYVFVRNGTSWSQEAKLTASDAAAYHSFGQSVSLSGDTALIGSIYGNGAVANSGAAYVFERSGTTWTQTTKLFSSNGAYGDEFGYSVSLSGDTAIVGAQNEDDLGTDTGAAYVYFRQGGTWNQQFKLSAPDVESGYDRFGSAVSISGSSFAIAAPYDYGEAGDTFGSVTFYDLTINNIPIAADYDLTLEEDTQNVLSLPATDTNNTALTASILTPPQHGSISVTGTDVTYTPDADYYGSDTYVYELTNGLSTSNAGSVSLDITPVDDPPTISGVPITQALANQFYSFTPTASDVDSGSLVFSLNLTLPAWATFDTNTGEISGTPAGSDVGTIANIIISVSDGVNPPVSLSAFSLTIDVNAPPVISGTPEAIAPVGIEYSFIPTATDADGDELTFSVVAQPSWATFNKTTGALTGTPELADVGEYSGIIISVSDGVNPDVSLPAFTVSVAVINQPPIITSTAPATATEDVEYSYQVQVNDPDDDNNGSDLTFTLNYEPLGMTISPTGLITWTPTEGVLDSGTGSANYSYKDSDEVDGPAYTWNDISGTGALLNISNQDDGNQEVALSFTFPYYDQEYGSIYVSTNGYLTVGQGSSSYAHYYLPSSLAPSGQIAVWNTDLNPSAGGDIYFQSFADYAVVQFENVSPYSGTGSVTCQAVINENGTIQFYYNQISMLESNSTIGIQNQDRTNGVTVSYNDNYVKDGLAVEFMPPGPINTSVTVSDGGEDGAQPATEYFYITVTPVNDPPTITSSPSLTASTNVQYTYQLEVSDPDDGGIGSGITVALSSGPSGMNLNTDTGLLTWTPGINDETSGLVVISVSDGGEDNAQPAIQSFTIDVPNSAPVITSTAPVNATEDIEYIYQVVVDDPNDPNDGVNLRFTLESYPAGMVISETGLITWTPGEGVLDSGSVTVKVEDDGEDGVSPDSQTFSIAVTPVNDPPVLSPVTATEAVESTLFTYQVEVTDPDDVNNGSGLSFSLSNQPGDMSVSVTGLISWTPAEGILTSGIVTLMVTDGGEDGALPDSITFSLDVPPINNPPSIISTAPEFAIEDIEYTYQVEVVDPDDANDGVQLTYSLSGNPDSMQVSATGLITWTPVDGEVSAGPVVLTVEDGREDGALPATEVFTVYATPVNEGPSISPVTVTSAIEDVEYVYQLQVSDPDDNNDGRDLSYQLSNAPAGMLVSSTGEITWTPIEGELDSGMVTVTVRDGGEDGALPASTDFTISVTPVNDAPVITSLPPPAFVVNQQYVYDVVVFDPDDSNDGAELSYNVTGPTGMEISNTGQLTWTPDSTFATSGEVTVTVSDGDEDGAEDAVQTFEISQRSAATAKLSLQQELPLGQVNESDASVIALDITVSGTVVSPITVSLDFNGTATITQDYTISPSDTLVFNATGTQTVNVIIVDDAEPDNFETIDVSLRSVDADVDGNVIISIIESVEDVALGPNQAPVLQPVADLQAIEGLVYSYQAIVSDPDDINNGVDLTWSLNGNPAGMTVSNLGLIRWTPPEGVLASGQVTLTVSDGEYSDSAPFTLNVVQINGEPEITAQAPDTAQVDVLYTYTPTISDEDVDNNVPLVFKLINYPDGMTINSSTGLIEWTSSTYTPVVSVSYTVTDSGGLSASESWNIELERPVPIMVNSAEIIAADRTGVEFEAGDESTPGRYYTNKSDFTIQGTVQDSQSDNQGTITLFGQLNGRHITAPVQFNGNVFTAILEDIPEDRYLISTAIFQIKDPTSIVDMDDATEIIVDYTGPEVTYSNIPYLVSGLHDRLILGPNTIEPVLPTDNPDVQKVKRNVIGVSDFAPEVIAEDALSGLDVGVNMATLTLNHSEDSQLTLELDPVDDTKASVVVQNTVFDFSTDYVMTVTAYDKAGNAGLTPGNIFSNKFYFTADVTSEGAGVGLWGSGYNRVEYIHAPHAYKVNSGDVELKRSDTGHGNNWIVPRDLPVTILYDSVQIPVTTEDYAGNIWTGNVELSLTEFYNRWVTTRKIFYEDQRSFPDGGNASGSLRGSYELFGRPGDLVFKNWSAEDLLTYNDPSGPDSTDLIGTTPSYLVYTPEGLTTSLIAIDNVYLDERTAFAGRTLRHRSIDNAESKNVASRIVGTFPYGNLSDPSIQELDINDEEKDENGQLIRGEYHDVSRDAYWRHVFVPSGFSNRMTGSASDLISASSTEMRFMGPTKDSYTPGWIDLALQYNHNDYYRLTTVTNGDQDQLKRRNKVTAFVTKTRAFNVIQFNDANLTEGSVYEPDQTVEFFFRGGFGENISRFDVTFTRNEDNAKLIVPYRVGRFYVDDNGERQDLANQLVLDIGSDGDDGDFGGTRCRTVYFEVFIPPHASGEYDVTLDYEDEHGAQWGLSFPRAMRVDENPVYLTVDRNRDGEIDLETDGIEHARDTKPTEPYLHPVDAVIAAGMNEDGLPELRGRFEIGLFIPELGPYDYYYLSAEDGTNPSQTTNGFKSKIRFYKDAVDTTPMSNDDLQWHDEHQPPESVYVECDSDAIITFTLNQGTYYYNSVPKREFRVAYVSTGIGIDGLAANINVAPGVGANGVSGNVYAAIPTEVFNTPEIGPDSVIFYNHQDGLPTSLGSNGWRTNFDQRLFDGAWNQTQNDGQDHLGVLPEDRRAEDLMVYIGESGRRYLFKYNDQSGRFDAVESSGMPEAYVELDIVLPAEGRFSDWGYSRRSGVYKLIAHDNTIKYFNRDGLLIAVEDLTGDGILVDYNNEYQAGYRPSAITDDCGRMSILTTKPVFSESLVDSPLFGKWEVGYDANGRLNEWKIKNPVDTDDERVWNISYNDLDQGNRITAYDQPGASAGVAVLREYTITPTPDNGEWPITAVQIDGPRNSQFLYEDFETGTMAWKKMTIAGAGTAASPDLVLTRQIDVDKYVISKTSNGSQSVSYVHDDKGNVTKMTVAGGSSTSFTWGDKGIDGANLLLTEQVSGGGTSTNDYYATGDAKGRIKSITNASGEVTAYQYDSNGNLSSMTDPRGKTWTYPNPDAYGNAQETIHPTTGRSSSQTFHDNGYYGNVASATDWEGYRNDFEYDDAHRLVKTTYPPLDGVRYSESQSYDFLGRLITSTDRLGATRTMQYDLEGRVFKITEPDNDPIEITYTDVGNTLKAETRQGTLDLGTEITDNLGRQLSLTEKVVVQRGEAPIDVTTFYTYTAAGQLYQVTDPETNLPVTHAYDTAGRLKTVTSQMGATTTYHYHASGELEKIVDPDGATVSYAYDADLRTIAEVGPLGARSETKYKNGVVDQVVNPDGTTINYHYDDDGLVWHIFDNYGNVQVIERTPTLVTTHTPVKPGVSVTTDIQKNTAGLVQAVSPGLLPVTTYSYYPDGVQKSVTYDGETSYSVTDRKQDGTIIGSKIDDQQGQSVQIENGIVSSISDPRGNSQRRQIHEVTGQALESSDSISVQFTILTWDKLGRELSWEDVDDNVYAVTYDDDGRRKTFLRPNGDLTTFNYTPGGRIESRVVRYQSGHTETTSYTYNDAGQVLTETMPDQSVTTNVYDKVGRLISKTQDGRNTQYHYTLDRLTSVDHPDGLTEIFTYDVVGNRTGRRVANRVWTNTIDDHGRLTDIETPDQRQLSKTFDAKGRMATATGPDGQTLTVDDYDSYGRLKKYTFGENYIETSIDYDPNTGEPWLITDNQGSFSRIGRDLRGRITHNGTYGNGQEVSNYTYHDNGQVHIAAGADGDRKEYVYDATGRLERIVFNNDEEIQLLYDNRDRIEYLIQPQGLTTQYSYDDGNRIVGITESHNLDGLISQWTFDYDPVTKQLKEVNGPGITKVYDYYPAGYLKEETVTGDESWSAAYEYDAFGNRTLETRSAIVAGHPRNGQHLTPLVGAWTIGVSDAVVSLDNTTASSGATGIFIPEGAEGLTLIEQPSTNKVVEINARLAVDDAVLAGYEVQYIADQAIQHARFAVRRDGSQWYLESWHLDLDTTQWTLGQQLAITAPADPVVYLRLAFTGTAFIATVNDQSLVQLGQLADANGGLVGAIKSMRLWAAGAANTQNISATYDLITVKDSTGVRNRHYTYDIADRLTGITDVSTGFRATFVYNDAGKVKKYTETEGGVLTFERNYFYDSYDRLELIKQRSDAGDNFADLIKIAYVGSGYKVSSIEDSNGSTSFTYVDGMIASSTTNGVTTTYARFEDKTYWQEDTDNGITHVLRAEHNDSGGSRAADGSLVRRNYNADGEVFERTESGDRDEVDSGPGYRGLWQHGPSGLVLMGARIYDPRIARFISEDPAQAGHNYYAYAGGDPVNQWDPTGLNYVWNSASQMWDEDIPFDLDVPDPNLYGFKPSDQGGKTTFRFEDVQAYGVWLQRAGGTPSRHNRTQRELNISANRLSFIGSGIVLDQLAASRNRRGTLPFGPKTTDRIVAELKKAEASLGVFDAVTAYAKEQKDLGETIARAVVEDPVGLINNIDKAVSEQKRKFKEQGLDYLVAIGIKAAEGTSDLAVKFANENPRGQVRMTTRFTIDAVGPGAIFKGLKGFKLLPAPTKFGGKVLKQLPKRGWTKRLVESTIAKPVRTVKTRDTRHLSGGNRLNDPATAYYSKRGGYVVRNDRTGDIVQVSDRTDPNWIAPWD